MKLIKLMMLAALLSLSSAAFAMTDDESVAYAGALQDGDIALVKKDLDTGVIGVDETHPLFGWTALQIAANRGQLEVVKLLVAHKANLNYQHEITKNTALQLAAMGGYTNVVQYLIDAGADVNLKMRGDVALLRVIRDQGNTKMVDILVKAGAKDDGCREEKCF